TTRRSGCSRSSAAALAPPTRQISSAAEPHSRMPPKYLPMTSARGWLPVIFLPAIVVALFPRDLPRWQFMWLLAFAIYAGCKWLTWRRTPAPHAPWWQHLGYLLLWPGMDAPTFLAPASRELVPSPPPQEWAFAAAKLVLGAAIFWGAQDVVPPSQPLVLGWAGMVGLVMMLHFGTFHLLSCAWRALGVRTVPLMDFPFRSTRLAEFWGVRWNRAFRDLTSRFLFRPYTRRFGATSGMLAGFTEIGRAHV